MPQVSSIIREPEEEDIPLEGLQNLTLASNPTRDEKDYWARLIDGPEVFSIFTLVSQFKIPACDLPRIYGVSSGQSDAMGVVSKRIYSLGAGVSCNVVVLDADESMSDVCSPGTRVVLKRYNAQPSDGHDLGTTTKKLYQWLSQELKVFCHPYLRDHENINKLHFVAWEESSLIPALGLELATYGTLEDCLQQLRSYGSNRRKCHLSLDIALGLAALSSLGLVHGDIKPGNIIICPHDKPERAVVAKIADLNGVAPASDYGSKQFIVGTPTWQPPEVIAMESNIDWQLADVYAFGMVMATLWATKGYIPLGGSFLDPLMPFQLEPEDKKVLTELYKMNQDYEPTGMIQLASGLFHVQDVGLPLKDIIGTTLSTVPQRRMPITDILHKHFDLFATITGRRHSILSIKQNSVLDAAYWTANSIDALLVLHPQYISRPRVFKEKMFNVLLSTGESLKNSVLIPSAVEIGENFAGNDEELSDLLRIENRQLQEILWTDGRLHRLGNLALNISMSYLLGIGETVDDRIAINWLRIGAQANEGNSVYWYCPLERSVGAEPQAYLPRKKWCANGVLYSFSSDAFCLKELDPSLYDTAMKMTRRRHWGRDSPQIVRIEPYLERIISPIKRNPALVDERVEARYGSSAVGERALHACVATGEMDLTRYLVLEANANINVTNDRNETPIFYATRAGQYDIVRFLYGLEADVSQVSNEGLSILHCLTSMDDDNAAELAPLFVDRGAKLQQAAEELPRDRKDNFVIGAGTPIFWAALKGKHLLFATLVKLHSQPGQQISPVEYYILLKAMATLNLNDALALALESETAIVDRELGFSATPTIEQVQKRFAIQNLGDLKSDVTEIIGFSGFGPRQYTSILYHALDTKVVTVLHRRYIHMGGFGRAKKVTIELLLSVGADPILKDDTENSESTALSCTVYTGDTIAFRLFITHLKSRRSDVVSILSNGELFGSYSALQRAIYSDAREIFLFLVDAFPDLLQLKGAEGRGPLQSAATQLWPGYVGTLLNHGASPYDRADDRSTPFTWALMRSPTTESAIVIAKMIAENADMEKLLGPDEKTGFTAFGKLLSAITYYKIDFGIERIQWLIDTYGKPSFYSNEHGKTTVFRTLLSQRPSPTDKAAIALEGTMLKFLLKNFPEKIDFIDNSGRSPLHMSVMFGNLSAVEILLENGADIHLQSQPMGEHRMLGGYTALGIAVWTRQQDIPDRILREGQLAAETYDKNLHNIIELLVRAGATDAGQGASFEISNLTEKVVSGTGNNIHVGRRSIRKKEADWPRRLPWEGDGPSPFEVSEGPETVTEILGEDGLSRTCGREGFMVLQGLVGAISKSAVSGNYVKEKSPAPAGFMDQVNSMISSRRAATIDTELFASGNLLPSGWEIRSTLQGQPYYVNHNTQTTSWQPPRRG
ncbi:Fc.00g032550.m01.CDS01 [Cosmosporella sp. VM-42]